MKKTTGFALATLVATIVGCATATGPVSMRGSDVAAPDRAPEAKNYPTKVPGSGEQNLIARTFLDQPPLIPHAIEKYEPLTSEENACVECHITDEFKGKKMPKMGASHFSKTLKEADGSPVMEMTRFVCTSCHVAQVDAPPLVENLFVGVLK